MAAILYIKVINATILPFFKERVEMWNKSKDMFSDSGFDLPSPEAILKERYPKITLGCACAAFTKNREKALTILLLQRSSNKEYPLANGSGLIDPGYRGPLMAQINNYHLDLINNIRRQNFIIQHFNKMIDMFVIVLWVLVGAMLIKVPILLTLYILLVSFKKGVVRTYINNYTTMKTFDVPDYPHIKQCNRHFQISLPEVGNDFQIEIVETLPSTRRGSNGFGSTGI